MSAQRQITGGKQDVQKTERQKGLHPRRADRRPGHLLREGDLGFRRLSRETACRWLRMFHVKHHLEIQGA